MSWPELSLPQPRIICERTPRRAPRQAASTRRTADTRAAEQRAEPADVPGETEQNRLPKREDFIAQQEDDLRVCPRLLRQRLRIRGEPLRNIPDRRKRQSQLLEDLGNAFEGAMPLQAQQ